jgi:hypothetical protein
MAYSFNGINQSLTTTSSPVTATPLTVFTRFNSAASGTAGICGIRGSGSGDAWTLSQAGASYPLTGSFTVRNPPTSIFTTIAAAISQNTWTTSTGVTASNTSRFLFIGTTKSAQNTSSVTPSPSSLEIQIGTEFSGFINAIIADTAIWDTDLTDAEVTSLVRGFKPYRVRPQNLQFYAPIVRNLQDLRGALTITNNNSATVADHPRVY